MSEIRFDHYELSQLVVASANGTISEEHSARLEEILLSDPAAREWWFQWHDVELGLADWAVIENTDGNPIMEIAKLETPAGRHFFWLSTLAVVASVVLFVSVFRFLQRNSIEPSGVRAQVIAADGTEVFADGQWLTLEDLRLKAGELRLRLENGVQLDFSGPVEAKFLSPMNLQLRSGKLTVNVGENGHGFTVATMESEIIDLGTQFGVDASARGTTDVVVFQGEVKVRPVSEASDSQWQSLTTGQAIRMKRRQAQRLYRVRMSEQLRDWSAVEVREGDIIVGAADNVSEEQFYQFVGLAPGALTEGAKAFLGNAHAAWQACEGQDFPSFLEGADLLRTYHKDRYDTGFELTLKLAQPCTLYVLIDQRLATPEWLTRDFEKTSEQINVGPFRKPFGPMAGLVANESGELFASCWIWKRRITKAGEVKLGPPKDQGGATIMYGVAANSVSPTVHD